MRFDNEEPQSRLVHNVEMVRNWTDNRWSSWFRAVTDERERRDPDPLRLHPSLRLSEEIEAIYLQLPERARYVLRIGLSQAVASWNPFHCSFGVLSRLVWIVSQIRAFEAIPMMLQIIRDHRYTILSGHPTTQDVADDLVSILGGFVPDPEGRIEHVFTELLGDDAIAPQLTGTFAVAISTRKPELFAQSFNRYYERRRSAPDDYFQDKYVLANFRNAIPKDEFFAGMKQLDVAAAAYFLRQGLHHGVVRIEEIIAPDGAGAPLAENTVIPFPEQQDVNQHAEQRYEMTCQELQARAIYPPAPAESRGKHRPVSAGPLSVNSVYAAFARLEAAPA